jgi:hypothetical protein
VRAACEHDRLDRKAKRRALDHSDMTAELAEILSTSVMQLSYEIETCTDTS